MPDEFPRIFDDGFWADAGSELDPEAVDGTLGGVFDLERGEPGIALEANPEWLTPSGEIVIPDVGSLAIWCGCFSRPVPAIRLCTTPLTAVDSFVPEEEVEDFPRWDRLRTAAWFAMARRMEIKVQDAGMRSHVEHRLVLSSEPKLGTHGFPIGYRKLLAFDSLLVIQTA